MRVVITGATGLLGRACYKAFQQTHSHAVSNGQHEKHEVIGLGYSRVASAPLDQDECCRLVKLDIQDKNAFKSLLDSVQPDVLVHCAAERRPDVAEKNKDETRALNAELPGWIAQQCREQKALFIYISTDYVFDGNKAPYNPSDSVNPINFYGETKAAGESAVRKQGVGGKNLVLRVPVLYGEAQSNEESAINVLVDVVSTNSLKKIKMDDFAIRYPTNVADVARCIVSLAELQKRETHIGLPPIMHFSAPERFTKYETCSVFSRLLGLRSPPDHLIPQSEAPAAEEATTRPKDCCLLGKEAHDDWQRLGIRPYTVGFEAWWAKTLQPPR